MRGAETNTGRDTDRNRISHDDYSGTGNIDEVVKL